MIEDIQGKIKIIEDRLRSDLYNISISNERKRNKSGWVISKAKLAIAILESNTLKVYLTSKQFHCGRYLYYNYKDNNKQFLPTIISRGPRTDDQLKIDIPNLLSIGSVLCINYLGKKVNMTVHIEPDVFTYSKFHIKIISCTAGTADLSSIIYNCLVLDIQENNIVSELKGRYINIYVDYRLRSRADVHQNILISVSLYPRASDPSYETIISILSPDNSVINRELKVIKQLEKIKFNCCNY